MKATILVVDDEEITRRTLADILRLDDYEVETESNGEDAIRRAQGKNFSVILLDVRMPGLSGIETLQALSKVSPRSQVILLTGYGSLESAIEAVRYQAADYLLKPVSSEEILNAVHRALVRYERKEVSNLHEPSAGYGESATRGTSVNNNLIVLGNGAALDLTRRWIICRAIRVDLTRAETRLLEVLIENHGKVVSQTELVQGVQGYEVSDVEATNIMRPLVSRLRTKLKQIPGYADALKNVRGAGYVLEMPEVVSPITHDNSLSQ